MRITPILLACSCASLVAAADETPGLDKSQYSLFNPTPSNALRPLTSDEADKVIGPYTVDAGHFQVEADLVNYYHHSQEWYYPDEHITRSASQFEWRPRFKVGLCNQADFEVAFAYATKTVTYDYAGVYQASHRYTSDGFGSVDPKFKINLWGNDGGMTALAVAPFLSIPTDGSGDVTGGLELPFAVHLPEAFTLKLFSEAFWYENPDRTVYLEFSNDASITKALTPHLDAFANISTHVLTEPNSDWNGYAGFGFSYTFDFDLQLYAGLRFGLTSNAYDDNPYLGLTWRY